MVYLIFAFAGLVITFYGGVIMGIADCKRQFGIPKGAVDGYYCTATTDSTEQ